MITVTVCIGSSCHLKGSKGVVDMFLQKLQAHGLEDQVELKASFCMDDCRNGVCVTVGDKKVRCASSENAAEVFEQDILPLVRG